MIGNVATLLCAGLTLTYGSKWGAGSKTGLGYTASSGVMLLPSGAHVLISPSGKRFIYLDGGYNNCQAHEACQYLGAQLSDIKQGPEVTYLAQTLKGTAWINSWDGNAYEGTPLAFVPGGAMARPDENGESPLGVLCDLPEPCPSTQ